MQNLFQRILLQGVGLLVWGAALYGTSLMHRITLPGEHSICGPWGCAAEPSALLGYHLFLLVLMAPMVVVGCQVAKEPKGKQIAQWVLYVGLIGAILFVVGGAGYWLFEGREAEYAVQRGLFLLATTPDLPFIQLCLSGLFALGFEQGKKKIGTNHIKIEGQQVDPLNTDGKEATISA